MAGLADVEQLRRAVRNELGSPELLPFAEAPVRTVLAAIAQQQEFINEAAGSGNADEAFVVTLYQMDIDRMQFEVSTYLRTRLRKIEKLCLHILMSPTLSARLSAEEQRFAEGYVQLLEGHMNSTVLDHLPEGFQGLVDMNKDKDERMVDGPDLDRFVFVRVNQDVGAIEMSAAGQRTLLQEGDVHVLRYEPIRELVEEGSVELI